MATNIWEGGLVRLRGIEASDWERFHTWNGDSEMARRSYLIPFPRSTEGTQRWAQSEATATPQGDAWRFAIETLGGELVGTLNTFACDQRNGTFSYGVAIGGEYRRHGYAAEAITLALRYYFRELRYQKCTVHVYSFNEASSALHEHLGFQQEGRIRRTLYTNGAYFDVLLYGITAQEFEAHHPAE